MAMRARSLMAALVALTIQEEARAQQAPAPAPGHIWTAAGETREREGGAAARTPVPVSGPPEEAFVPRSRGRATAGKILCGVGVLLTTTAGMITAAAWDDTGGWVIIGTGPAMGTGALLGAVGAPLWATGNALVPAESEGQERDEEPPDAEWTESAARGARIAFGPGSVAMRWSF